MTDASLRPDIVTVCGGKVMKFERNFLEDGILFRTTLERRAERLVCTFWNGVDPSTCIGMVEVVVNSFEENVRKLFNALFFLEKATSENIHAIYAEEGRQVQVIFSGVAAAKSL